MSDVTAFEQAAGQAGQTAGAALQALILMAKAVSEHQERRAAAAQLTAAQAQQQQPTADPQLERLAQAVREKIQPPEVAAEMVAGPGWPQLAAELQRLERSGVDVRVFLGDAAPLVQRIDNDLRASAAHPGVRVPPQALTPRDPWAPPPSERRRDTDRPGIGRRTTEAVKRAGSRIRERWQKWRERRNPSALGDRSKALAAEGIGPQLNARLVIIARESVADERVLGSLVTSRQWPAIAGQMNRLREAGRDPREALAGVPARISQAAATGVRITAAEAAQGLLSEAARSAASAATAAAPASIIPSAAPAPAVPGSSPVPSAPSRPAPVSSAPSAQGQISHEWKITQGSYVCASGQEFFPAGPGERAAIEKFAAEQLARETGLLGPADPRRRSYLFSNDPPSGSPVAVQMNAADRGVIEASGMTAPASTSVAEAAKSRSTTTLSAPGPSPTAATPSTSATPLAAAPSHRPTR